MKSIPLAVAHILATGALTALVTHTAQAQDAAGDKQADDQAIKRVVVTGSYISRADQETPSPVQVMTAADLKKSGYTTVSEALRDITANGQGTLSQGFNSFAAGASGVSLRGMTVGATLVLIDGHRMAPYPLSDDGQRPFVDISSIPMEAVERIEILKDGASAVYGSDAIAGVVNVILKKSFQGTSVLAETGTTQHGGGATHHLSLMRGFDLSDNTNGYVAVEYRHQDQIRLDQRNGPWTRMDWSGDPGGRDLRPGARNSIVSNPVTLTPYLQDPAQAGVASAYAFLDNGCDFARRNANQCVFTNTWSQVQPTTENLDLLASLTSRLNENWTLGLKASYFDSKGQQTIRDSTIPVGSFAGVTAIGPNRAPAIVGTIDPGAYTVPASYPGNPFGHAAYVRAMVPDTPFRRTDIDTKSYRAVADLNGTVAGWDIAASLGLTRVETETIYHGYLNPTALQQALNDTANPFKLTGGNSPAVMAKVTPTVRGKATDTLNFVELRASRELAKLEGGPLSLGTGLSFVHKSLNAPDPAEAQDGSVNALPNAYAIGKENNTALYAELAAPVLKTLELDAAVRADHYDTYGHSYTPKVGFKFTPSSMFSLRGTASRGFRAPSATENGTGGLLYAFNTIRDPVLCPESNPDGSPNTDSPRNVPAQCELSPTYLQTTTKDLQPEKSKSYTLGVIIEPIKNWSTTLDYYKITVDNQIISASALASFDPLLYAVRGGPETVTYGDGSTGTSPVGTIQYISTPYVNGQTTSTAGAEFETRYRFKLNEAARMTVGLQWSHMFNYNMTLNGKTYNLAGTHGPAIVSGDTGNPKDRAQFTLSYDQGPFTISATTNYVSGFDVTDPSNGLTDCDSSLQANNSRWKAGQAPAQYCKVSSFTYTNLSMSYQINKAWTLSGSITNLFDRSPPVDAQTYGGNGINASSNGTGAAYNPSLHETGAVGRFYNVGLNYKF
ncbi:MAG TPA: TonB-dependent receptor [Burkholderiaceae bacterium]|nr:TonB-dependent receptor [Burkholderiaceae bacterium]